MSAADRLQPSIWFDSPGFVFDSYHEFYAQWVGDDFTLTKRLGRFNFPKVNGSTAQDLGLESTDYPLTMYFDDTDHDQTTQKFLAALAKEGSWTVGHPVRGVKKLQPIAFTVKDQPIESATYTIIASTWFEPITQPKGEIDLAANVTAQSEIANQAAAAQAAANIVQSSPDLVAAAAGSITSCLGKIKSVIEIPQGYAATIYGQIQSLATSATIDVFSLAGSVQNLLATPGLIAGDISSRLAYWGQLTSALLSVDPSSPTPAAKNVTSVVELFASAAISAAALDALTAPPTTRQEAINATVTLRQIFDSLTNGLDSVQTLFANLGIQQQYFSQSQGFPDFATLIGRVNAWLIGLASGLKVARVLVLDHDRATYEVAIKEYKATADTAETFFDFLVASNRLANDELWMLRQGREIVIYG